MCVNGNVYISAVQMRSTEQVRKRTVPRPCTNNVDVVEYENFTRPTIPGKVYDLFRSVLLLRFNKSSRKY